MPKRIMIVRDAAVGDGLMVTPAVHDLADKGYEVFVATKKIVGDAVFACNPHVTKLLRLEAQTDMKARSKRIQELADKHKIDVVADCAFTCEGKYLFHRDSPNYDKPLEFRRALSEHVSYYEHINREILRCERTRPELYVHPNEEHFWVSLRSRKLGARFVQIQLTGSSINKMYPFWPVVIKSLLTTDPRVIVLTTGDPLLGKIIETSCAEFGCDPRRIWAACGDKRMTLRDSIVATKFVNVVVGPETGVINAAGCFDTPKVVLLTHSNARNLCAGWENCYPIQAPVACSPCYRIVSPGDDCDYITEAENKDIAGAMRCMAMIDPGTVTMRIFEALKGKQ